MLLRSGLCAGLLLLTACTHQRYASEAETVVDMPTTYGGLKSQLSDDTLPPIEACADLGLPQMGTLLAQQRENNFQGLAAEARVKQARALADQAGASRWPQVNGNLGGERAESQIVGLDLPFAPSGPTTQYIGSVAASWEVDVWRRLSSSAKAASLESSGAFALNQATQVALSSGLAETWTQVLANRELIDLIDEQVKASEAFLKLTRLRFAQGQTTAVAVAQQQLQLESLRTLRARTLSQLRTKKNDVVRLVGSTSALPELANGLPPIPAVARTDVPADIALLRPDVFAARVALQAADERSAAAMAQRLPALRISADLVSVENSLGDLFEQTFWTVGAGLVGPIFNAGGLRAAQAAAESRAEQALYEFADALLNAFVDVQSAIDLNVTQAQILESLATQAATADAVLRLATESYRQGSAAYLDVLTALQSQQQVSQELVRARAQQIVHRIQLCRAIGLGVGAS